MDKDTTYVALDDSKRKIVAGILRPGETQPELRECRTIRATSGDSSSG